MKKLGVIQIIDSLNLGGAEVLAVNIANGLQKTNINSFICCTRKEGILKDNICNGVGYLYLKRKSTFDISAIIKLKKYIKTNNITIIHAHSSSYFISICVKLILPRIKIVWHDHFGNSDFLNMRKKIPLNIFSVLFSTIIVVNNKLYHWSKNNLKSKNVVFLRNFPFFNNLESKTLLKGSDNKRIVHVAGYREQKDHLNLLNAFKLCNDLHSEWTLHLIGKDYNDSYSNQIKSFIRDNNLEDKVFEYGVCTDIKNILNQSTIGVLSSKSEGLPISLLEYGLSNLPIVTTNVGECKLFINDNRFIVPASNYKLLSDALNTVIESLNIQIIQGKNNYNTIQEKFSRKIFLKQLTLLYNKHC